MTIYKAVYDPPNQMFCDTTETLGHFLCYDSAVDRLRKKFESYGRPFTEKDGYFTFDDNNPHYYGGDGRVKEIEVLP